MGNLSTIKYYQNPHKHTSLSHRYNKDSPLVHKDYFNHIAKMSMDGYPQIYSTVEHGWQGNYFKIYDDLENFNSDNHKEKLKNKKGVYKDNPYYSENYKDIKFVFGTEAYWVNDRFEKDSTNNHILLLAKNNNGRKKINRAIYESYNSGYYYKGRMDLDILLSLPKDDVFVTSACVAFWGYDKNKTPEGNTIYDESFKNTDEIIFKLNTHFTDFYLEVQPHNTPLQKMINKHIIELHNKYNIPIIAGVDSHIINESQFEDREDLLRSNKIHYDDEEGWFMDYPSLEVLIKRFREQEVLTDNEIYDAINNTNKTLDFEDIILDRSLKVPVANKYKHLSQKERNDIFENILRKEWKLQIDDINKEKYSQYIEEIKHDIKEVEDCNMADYFIDNYEIMKLGQEKYGGILTPSGRGSGVSMFLNKLLRFTKVDKVNSPVLMYSERFLTASRVLDSKTPPDIDHNVSKREPFIQAQKDVICEEGTFDLLALGTLHYKSAFKMYARAYNLDPQVANEVTKQIDKYEKAMKYAEEDEKDLIDIFDYVDEEKYGELIEGCQQYKGIVDNLKSHPCFTSDALVMTNIGLKKINNITTDDEVLTIDNSFKKVKKIMNRESDDIYSLKIQGSTPIEVTGNHPFYVANRVAKNNKYFSGTDRRELENKRWVDVENIKKGDLVGVAINQNSILPKIDFVDSNNNNFWWCIGRYLGDGWRSHTIRKSGRRKGAKIKDVIICCNKNNNETYDIIEKLTWCNYRVSENKTTNKIYLKSKGLYDWLEQFGDYAKNKHLTNTILDLPIEQLKSLLDGYFSADGHFDGENQSFTTISKELGLGIIACINKAYKRPCTFYIRKEAGTEYIEGRKVNCNKKYGGSFHYDDRKTDRAFYKDGLIWTPFQKKEKLEKKDTVYNLEVEGNHTYTVNNLIVHNCGCLCYDGDAVEDLGVIMVKSESTGRECFVALIESGTIDAFGYLKQDYLIVDSIGLTYEIYKEIGIEPMSVNELLKAIDNDEKTWDIYKNGYTMCINQAEQEKSTQKAMRYKMKNISELTQWIAGIRPSFKTMYKKFENREHFEYGIKALDDLIQDAYCTSSFILYQENLMKILGFANFKMGETYTIIKAISKKKEDKIKKAKEHFIPQFAEAILETGETSDINKAQELAEKVWEIVDASAQYGFNSAHAFCMAIDSVTLAWQKAHHPLEFYKVALQWYTNKGNKDKVSSLKQEMISIGITLNPIKFGDDNRQFSINIETKSISQTMASIKDMQQIVPDIMYELGKKKYNSFLYILGDIKNTKINKKSIEILIELDYFSEFGDPHYLKSQVKVYDELSSMYNKLKECKQLRKKDLFLPLEEVIPCCGKGIEEDKKTLMDINNEALLDVFKRHYRQLLIDVNKKYPYTPITPLNRIQYEVSRLGYTDITDDSADTRLYCLLSEEKNSWGTTFFTLYNIYSGDIKNVKLDKKAYSATKVEVGDILMCALDKKRKGHYEEIDGKKKWVDDEGYNDILISYGKI